MTSRMQVARGIARGAVVTDRGLIQAPHEQVRAYPAKCSVR